MSPQVADFASNSQHPFSLLKIIGGWGNVSGPGLVMFRSLLAGTYTAVVVGISTTLVASALWGTAALPFVLGSSLGFTIGSLRWYMSAERAALFDLYRYPSLLRLHLLANFPYHGELSRNGVEWYTPSRFKSSWTLKSMLVAAWLSAQPAIEDIQTRTESEVVAGYTVDDYMMDGNRGKEE
ncbi:sugar transporter [Metarhizium guizhouense ARSEF 977]|uniref:Sugar transporter n=1 Tax=Metarhizium guizhouense (strain ARSEF 977) TaxID=1276136 RepID=A0A0B4GI40_METGA|nr:sugar transporter [Metarhizium guizhouense ARSEF 977]